VEPAAAWQFFIDDDQNPERDDWISSCTEGGWSQSGAFEKPSSSNALAANFHTKGLETMKFIMLYRPGKETTAPPSCEQQAAMGKTIEEWCKAGVLLSTEGLQHSSTGARVRISGESLSVIEGPFPDAANLVGGYAILQTQSKAEAIDLAKGFLKMVGEGESEIRELYSSCSQFSAATPAEMASMK
jgi:hypothetical protein